MQDSHKHLTGPVGLPDLLNSEQAKTLSPQARERLTWIAHYLGGPGNTDDTCAHFGISRSTFYRWLSRFDPNDLQTLEERSHEPRSLRLPEATPEVVALIRGYRETSPLIGKQQIAALLASEHGILLSGSSVGRVVERECLYFADTPLHRKKRLQAEARKNGNSVTSLTTEALPGTASDERPQLPAPTTGHHLLDRRRIRRAAVWASILTNLVFLVSLMAAAAWESVRSDTAVTTQADEHILQSAASLLSDDE